MGDLELEMPAHTHQLASSAWCRDFLPNGRGIKEREFEYSIDVSQFIGFIGESLVDLGNVVRVILTRDEMWMILTAKVTTSA